MNRNKIAVIECGGSIADALRIAELCERTGSEVVIVKPENRADQFIEQCLEGFHITEPLPEFPETYFEKKQSEGRRFDGSPKNRF